jgi:hypothetical protein
LSSGFSFPGGTAIDDFYAYTPSESGIYKYDSSAQSWTQYFEGGGGFGAERYSIGGVIW